MRIQTIGAGPHPDISVTGATVTLAGHLIDCAAEQRDERAIIDLYRDGDTLSRTPGGRRIAAVEIPPIAYVETDDERAPLPLDADAILLTLWEM